MKKSWIILIIILVALFFIFRGDSGQPELSGETISIGVIEPLSGNAAYYGNLNQKGVLVAKGVLKERYPEITFETYHQDSLYTPKGGVDSYISLKSNNNLDAVITHASHVSIAIQPLAESDGILQMAVSASANGYSSPNDLSFRVSAKTDLEAIPMAKFIKDQGYEKLAIIYFQNDIGVSMAESLVLELENISSDTEVVLNEPFLIETTDFRSVLSKIKQREADAVYIVGLASNIASVLNQATELELDTQFLGFRATEDPTLLNNAPETSSGLIYTYSFDPNSNDRAVKDFVEEYMSVYDEVPDGYAAEGYEAMILVAESFVECGRDYVCIQEYLENISDRRSIFGDISFDENGDISYDFFLKEVRDGQFVKFEE